LSGQHVPTDRGGSSRPTTGPAPATAAVLVCDLDGVIRQFDQESTAAVERDLGLSQGFIADIAFERSRLDVAIKGTVSDGAWRASVVQELARFVAESDAEAAVSEWCRSPGTLDPDVLGLVRAARTRVPVMLFTNATTRLRSDLAVLGVLHEFDAIISSAETDHVKPEPGAYAAAEQAVESLVGRRVTSTQILFFDDSVSNVEAAAARGWHASQFLDTAIMKSVLVAAAVLP